MYNARTSVKSILAFGGRRPNCFSAFHIRQSYREWAQQINNVHFLLFSVVEWRERRGLLNCSSYASFAPETEERVDEEGNSVNDGEGALRQADVPRLGLVRVLVLLDSEGSGGDEESAAGYAVENVLRRKKNRVRDGSS